MTVNYEVLIYDRWDDSKVNAIYVLVDYVLHLN
jgi:hypothetical protein